MANTNIAICIVGYGRAGAARERAIAADCTRLSLAGVLSRRPGVGSLASIDAAVAAGTDAFIVCTENEDHEDSVRACLLARRHVCVEYPLATSVAAGAQLLALAAQQGLVLHVEHIELLAAAEVHHHMRMRQAEKTAAGIPLLRLDAAFSGSSLSQSWGHPAWSGFARLTRAIDLVGPLEPVSAIFSSAPTLERSHASATGTPISFVLDTVLRSNRFPGCEVHWREQRSIGAQRATSLVLRFGDGSAISTESAAAELAANAPTAGTEPRAEKGLFSRDLALFLASIEGQRTDPEAAGHARAAHAARELAWMAVAEGVECLSPSPLWLAHDCLEAAET